MIQGPLPIGQYRTFYPEIHVRGISIIGAHADVRPFHDRSANFWTWKEDGELALQLMASGRLQVEPMISEIFPWKQAARAYRLLQQNALPSLGLLLDWRVG